MPSASKPKVSATFKVKGADRLAALARGAPARVKAAARGVIATYVIKIERKLKQKLAEPGSGATYTRGGVTHQASAPGEAPATDTGRYRSSIRHELSRMAGRVVANVEYAAALERGTDDIDPRPMWEPVIREVSEDFFDDLASAVFQAL